MALGLFDLPAPLLHWVDGRVAAIIPAPVSIALWAVIGAVLCLELYRLASPQKRIRELKQDAKTAQERLASYDGEFEGAWPLMRAMLGLSLQRVGIVVPATLLAAYPVIALLVWLSSAYGHSFPARGEGVAVDASPLMAQWIDGEGRSPPLIQASDAEGDVVLELPLPARITVLHKRAWWNRLMENPAGYLPDDAPVDHIRISLPQRDLLGFGPSWMRGWEAVFLPVLFVTALAWKSARRID